jgi:hypothetical protein
MKALAGWILITAGALTAQSSHPPVNAGSATIQDFEKRVDAYLQLRKSVESKLAPLKATLAPEEITKRQHELAQALREARKTARQGDIFTPEITMEFRRLIGLATQPGDGPRVRQSLRSAEPVVLRLSVNDNWPERVPLQSTPPTLLQNLPKLPDAVEYRLAGGDLILLDAKANLVIDLISRITPGITPRLTPGRAPNVSH